MFPSNDHIDSQFKWSHVFVNIDVEIVTVSWFHLSIVYDQCSLCRRDVQNMYHVSMALCAWKCTVLSLCVIGIMWD